MSRSRDRAPIRCLLLAGLVLALPLAAATPARAENATAKVPADASFFASMLRNREQIDALMKSKGYKRLMDLGLVKMGLKKLQEELGKEGNPLGQALKFFEAKENKELLDVLIEAGSEEIFLYG